MTPEERLARLEARADGSEAWLEKIDGKVDQLVALSHIGKGAISVFLKVGGVLSALVGIAIAVFDRIPHK